MTWAALPAARKKYRYSGEFGSFTTHPGAPWPAAAYPQDIHKFIVIREFGSLKALDTGLGPRAFHGITRALGPRSFGLDPRPMSRETI